MNRKPGRPQSCPAEVLQRVLTCVGVDSPIAQSAPNSTLTGFLRQGGHRTGGRRTCLDCYEHERLKRY